MNALRTIKDALLHLLYPNICAGCGTDALPTNSSLCVKCLFQLPATGFEKHTGNPIEKLLIGRANVYHATAQFYFTKRSLLQTLMHQFKYKGNKELGRQLGMIMGNQLQESNRFTNIEGIIPLPLFKSKERKRGYNQAAILCNGIAEVMHCPVISNVVIRTVATETQTRKNRIERWYNMQNTFSLKCPEKIENKHLLLVDDVITTGATIEACATTLLNVKGVTLNVATLAFASKI